MNKAIRLLIVAAMLIPPSVAGAGKTADAVFKGNYPTTAYDVPCAIDGNTASWNQPATCNLATVSGSVPSSRTVTAGAGLTNGGALSSNITLNVGANGDGSIVVNADDIKVGVITDTEHGNRGGGSLHSAATTSVAGFLSSTDKLKLDTDLIGSLTANRVPFALGTHSLTDDANFTYDPTLQTLSTACFESINDSSELCSFANVMLGASGGIKDVPFFSALHTLDHDTGNFEYTKTTHNLMLDGGFWAEDIQSDGGVTAQGVVTGKQGASFGTSDQSHVDNGGNWTKIRGVNYSWPSAGGTAGCFKVDASGNITVDSSCGGSSTGGGGAATAQEVYPVFGKLSAAHSPLSGDSLGQSNGLSVDTTFTNAYLTASCELPGSTGTAHFNVYDVTADAMVFATALAVPCGCTQGLPYDIERGAITQSSTHDYRIVPTASSECTTYPGLTFTAQLTADISVSSADAGTFLTGCGLTNCTTPLVSDYTVFGSLAALRQVGQTNGAIAAQTFTDSTSKSSVALSTVGAGALLDGGVFIVDLSGTVVSPTNNYPSLGVDVSTGTTNNSSTVYGFDVYNGVGLNQFTTTLGGARSADNFNSTLTSSVVGGDGRIHLRVLGDGKFLHFQNCQDGFFCVDELTITLPTGLTAFGFDLGNGATGYYSHSLIFQNSIHGLTVPVATVIGVSVANPARITFSGPHGFADGDCVAFHLVGGATGVNNDGANGAGPSGFSNGSDCWIVRTGSACSGSACSSSQAEIPFNNGNTWTSGGKGYDTTQ